MSVSEVKYRRPLNSEQIVVLDTLFRYRFSTNEQLARYFSKQSGKAVQKRLAILEAQGYIAKHYDGSYKLRGKPAEYYLLPKGARVLREKLKKEKSSLIITDQAIKNLYKDKNASGSFIAHSTSVFNIYLSLRNLYGDKPHFFTKTFMNIEKYDYIIKPLPDAHIALVVGDTDSKQRKRFFLDYSEDDVPFFVLIRRIKKYIKYYEEDEWPGDVFPVVLFITESPRRQKQLQRRIAKELRDAYMEDDDMIFATTTIGALAASTKEADAIWQLVSDPEEVLDLYSIT